MHMSIFKKNTTKKEIETVKNETVGRSDPS